MPKKKITMSPEQRQAASERMRAMWAAKKAQQSVQPDVAATELAEEQPVEEPAVAEPVAPLAPSEANVDVLLKRIEELEKMAFFTNPAFMQAAQVTQRGLVGTTTKFSVDPKDYPDPRERLADEPKLAQHAFRHNFELGWQVSSVSYQTKDGLNMREPKFQLELYRVMMDDEGNPTNKRYTVCKATFFEDPDAALAIARERGIEVPETAEKLFLDEMRYLRMRDWLLEAFYPARPIQKKINKKEMVIGNRLVEVFEINSETSETIPFSQLKTKV